MQTETKKVFLPSPSSLGVTAQELDDFSENFLEEHSEFNIGSAGDWNKLIRSTSGLEMELAAANLMTAITDVESTYKAITVTSFVKGVAFALNALSGGRQGQTLPTTQEQEQEVGC